MRFVLGALAILLVPMSALAAFPTKVLSGLEGDKTLPDLQLGLTFDHGEKRGKITREWVQDGEALDIKELAYKEITNRLLLDLRVGVFHDIEFHVQAPIVLSNDSAISFLEGVDGRSTIFGSSNANDPAYVDAVGNSLRYPITSVPGERERSGFGDMTFGIAWSPVVDQEDEAYPTMTLRADVVVPTGKTRDPADIKALPGGNNGSVGLGMTVFDFSLGLSKRVHTSVPTLDPYMIFGAQIPIPTPKQRSRGLEPPPTGRFRVGSEVLIHEEPKDEIRYAIDVSFGAKYIPIGRTYSELSDYLPNFNPTLIPGNREANSTLSPAQVTYEDFDNSANYAAPSDGASCGVTANVPCGELNRVDEHLTLDTALAVHIRPSKFAFFRAGVAFGFDTDHFLTTERAGADTDPANLDPGQRCIDGQCFGRVNAVNSLGQDERSQYFDPRYDTPGRRFRIEDVSHFVVFATGVASF